MQVTVDLGRSREVRTGRGTKEKVDPGLKYDNILICFIFIEEKYQYQVPILCENCCNVVSKDSKMEIIFKINLTIRFILLDNLAACDRYKMFMGFC